jgi:hypothetical protein
MYGSMNRLHFDCRVHVGCVHISVSPAHQTRSARAVHMFPESEKEREKKRTQISRTKLSCPYSVKRYLAGTPHVTHRFEHIAARCASDCSAWEAELSAYRPSILRISSSGSVASHSEQLQSPRITQLALRNGPPPTPPLWSLLTSHVSKWPTQLLHFVSGRFLPASFE